MKLELGLSNLQDDLRTADPVVRVTATIEEGDSVTVGSQFMQEFALESLGDFLGEVRDDKNVEVDGTFEEIESKDANELSDELNDGDNIEDGDLLSREEANEIAVADQEADALEEEQPKE